MRVGRVTILMCALALAGACVLDRTGQLSMEPGAGGAGGSEGGSGGVGNAGGAEGGAGGAVDLPPGAVTNLAVDVDGTVNLAWTNPADDDLVSVLVVHRPGAAVTFTPVDGLTYDEGMLMMAGHEVVFSALGDTASFAPVIPGLAHHVAVWALDAGGHYSEVTIGDGLSNDLGNQAGQIQVALDGTVTVTQQPADFPLTGTASYNSGLDQLTVDLTVTNDTARVVFNLKGVSLNLNQGLGSGPTLPPGGAGSPYFYFGPQGLDVAASMQAQLVIDNVDGNVDPITFDISLLDAPWVIGHQRDSGKVTQQLLFVDSSGGGEQPLVDSIMGATDVFKFRDITVAPDGRRAFVGGKAAPFVTAVDLLNLSLNAGADLAGGRPGMVTGVRMSPDGSRLFASLTVGSHLRSGGGDTTGMGGTSTEVALVELEPATLSEIQRLDIVMADAERHMGRTIAVNADGTMAAVIVRQAWGATAPAEIYLVDLDTFALIDTNIATQVIDPIVLTSDVDPDHMLFSADGTTLYVAMSQGAGVEVINLTSFTALTWSPADPKQRSTSLYLLDDAILVGSDNLTPNLGTGIGLTRFALSDGAETVMSGMGEVRKIVGNDERYFVMGQTTALVFDAATNTPIDMDGDPSNGVTPLRLQTDRRFANHFGVITPF